MNKEDEFFLEKMRGVVPIKKNNKIKKESLRIKKNILKKDKKITTTPTKQNEPSKENINKKFKIENLSLKKNIKKGSFKINKKIDFHGLTIQESEEIFSNSILECYKAGQRCILFITGKGLYNNSTTGSYEEPKLYHGVIRKHFQNWVNTKKFSKYILSYEVASSKHGGDGAFYVYLRKTKE